MINSDDDYCVSYTVTMVGVRSCTRPSRLMNQQQISEYSNMTTYPRSPDQTHISEYPDISRQSRSLCPASSTSIGQYYHHMCIIYVLQLNLQFGPF